MSELEAPELEEMSFDAACLKYGQGWLQKAQRDGWVPMATRAAFRRPRTVQPLPGDLEGT